MDKELIRNEKKSQRKNLTKEEIKTKSEKIFYTLFSSDALLGAKTIMLYLPSFNEVRTEAIAKKLLQDEKRVVAPVTNKENFSMTPYLIKDMQNLQIGAYGIKEPKRDLPIDKSKIDAVIVPGIAFDKSGNRVGFGAGYYDRFLKDFAGVKIGICYDFQIVDKLDTKKHDIKMDYVISEDKIYVI